MFVKSFIVTVLLLLATSVSAAVPIDCTKNNKLYCKILLFNPKVSKTFAMDISNRIYKKAKKANISPDIALAVLMHESGLRNVTTYKTIIKVTNECNTTDCVKTTTVTERVFDIGLSQINLETARQYGFDINRLVKGDMDYSLDCFMTVLADKMNLCKKLGKAPTYSCYHSVNDYHRLFYADFVNRYL